jgi:hypothetical protein
MRFPLVEVQGEVGEAISGDLADVAVSTAVVSRSALVWS